ncbi:hypothetical protein [Paenibacillus sp. R14(2021)]|uniref:hypothetical protein n=1 Tax=Paenibacillus sp. R14(2021) TaxID=2859228 RepID=UPI001C614040|nr:hypothetical protein [Paenibacillus sp. R14(2021)]
MMSNANQFCCVDCGKLLVRDEAELVFRTGFFRVIYPLGYCKACSAFPKQGRQELLANEPSHRSAAVKPSFEAALLEPVYAENRFLIFS